MSSVNFSAIRQAMAAVPSDHDATGEHRPSTKEIFAPIHHANALDPNTPVVVGARGMGKSFWAGVLCHEDTKQIASRAYPKLKLDQITVESGYDGQNITSRVIEARVPIGEEHRVAFDFWQAVVMDAVMRVISPTESPKLADIMKQFADPEDAAQELARLDKTLEQNKQSVLVTFDALDTISRDWQRSALLMDALFEMIWSLRSRRAIRAKLFIRPEQLWDPALRFIELPKLRSSAIELSWSQAELYGMLFWQLAQSEQNGRESFAMLVEQAGARIPENLINNRQQWVLLYDPGTQKKIVSALAGTYMGNGKKKGGTYDWPFKHLADAKGQVTPRSFIKLFTEAAKASEPEHQAITAEGIREGLRAASKVRVDQLGVEYKWIKRALLPLAGLSVPCTEESLHARWDESNTINKIMEAAKDQNTGYLPPFPPEAHENCLELLTAAMENIAVIGRRSDDRIDMPDLFRIAAKMLKKGAVAPNKSMSFR